MNNNKLRILYLEDSAVDYQLVARELHEVAHVDVAINREMFETMLREPFDVILMDMALHGFSGEEALKLVKQIAPDVPVILCTGSVNDATARTYMRSGAVDYIIKDRLGRLPEAIRVAHENHMLRHQSMRDQRLELLGQLSAGIVHDFNSILAVVMMGAEQLRVRINPTDEKILDIILSASKRGAEMTGQVLAFARGTNGSAFDNVSPEYLIGQIDQLMRTTFPPNIRIETQTAIGTNSVMGDATQLAQVLGNLVTNARDAMPSGGTLRITAQNMAGTPGIQGPCVVISVSDTGTGIPAELLDRCWEPFVTSKPPGKGTGLGLPTVKRIVDAHHGIVKVITGPEGTTFYVHLPIVVPFTSATVNPIETLNGGGKTVLLVDDQQSFLDLSALILEGAHYRVLTAQNGPEALSQFRVGQQIDIVVTDESMPVMTGSEMIQNLRAVGINIPAILLSGYDASASVDLDVNARLQKPVTRDKLLSTIAQVLTQAGAKPKPNP